MPKKVPQSTTKSTTKITRDSQKVIAERNARYWAAHRAPGFASIARHSADQKASAAKARARRDAEIAATLKAGGSINDIYSNIVEHKTGDVDLDAEYTVTKTTTKPKKHKVVVIKDHTLLRCKSIAPSKCMNAKKAPASTEAFPVMKTVTRTSKEDAMKAKLRKEFDQRAYAAHKRTLARRKAKEDGLKAERARKMPTCNHGARCFRILTGCRYAHTKEDIVEATKKYRDTVDWGLKTMVTFSNAFTKWVNRIGDDDTSIASVKIALSSIMKKARNVHTKMSRAMSNLGMTSMPKHSEATQMVDRMQEDLDDIMGKVAELEAVEAVNVDEFKNDKIGAFSLADRVEQILKSRQETSEDIDDDE